MGRPSGTRRLGIVLGASLLAATLSFRVDAGLGAPSQGDWETASKSEARLLSATTGTGNSGTLSLGVEIKLHDGWKTYWRSPGDAGLPPTIDWTGSENFKAASLSYPAPHRFEVLDLQTVGYAGHVIFPLAVELNDRGAPFAGKARLDILVCEKLCIPQSFDLKIAVAAGPSSLSDDAQHINRFQSAVPGDGHASGFALKSTTSVRTSAGEGALQVVVQSRDTFLSPDLFPELKSDIELGRPQVALSADRTIATFTVPVTRPPPPGVNLASQKAVLTIVDGARSAEFRSDVTKGADSATPASERLALLVSIAAMALLGGFILNFMPCVLPILSIKVVSFAEESGRTRESIRTGMLATAAGVIVSMLAIGAGLIGLKAWGLAIGWGIQFQQPLFIAGMALLLTLFACNFWGFFEVALPGAVSNVAANAGGDGRSIGSNFLIGAFATLLATPCSAPFVGTAVGFALGQGPTEVFVIFAALGIGLAAPYLLLAAAPVVASLMPRPGPWMETLRRVMGLALAGTAAWLLTVLVGQVGWQAAGLIGGCLAAIAGGLWFAHAHLSQRRATYAATAALGVAIVLTGAFAARFAGPRSGADEGRIAWRPLQQDEIKSLVAQGKTVFVDVTADWCITCKANKRLVIDRPPLSDKIARETVAMRGDWTSPDPEITAFLARFGRYGVPFNVVFGPAMAGGIALPEVLTPQAVQDALDRAGGVAAAAPDTKGKG